MMNSFFSRATVVAVFLGVFALAAAPAGAQTEDEINQAEAALTAELGLTGADQIRATDSQEFYDALYNIAQASPGLARALAVVVVRSADVNDGLIAQVLGKSAAAIIAGANLTGDEARVVFEAISAALFATSRSVDSDKNVKNVIPFDETIMPEIVDIAYQSLGLFVAGDALNNLRTNSIFNFSAPPGASEDYQLTEEINRRLIQAGQATPRPTPVSTNQGQVTPSQNI